MNATQFSDTELAQDGSQARRLIGNAQVSLWDIDRENLTDREAKRLTTINKKLGELESIIEEREVSELSE